MSSYKEYPTWPLYLYLSDDDLSKSLQQPAARHPSNNMVPRRCFSAVLFHEAKRNGHGEKLEAHIVNGKDIERPNRKDELSQNWLHKQLCKVFSLKLVASVQLYTLEMSIGLWSK